MALNGLFCADVPLRNYSLTHSFLFVSFVYKIIDFFLITVFQSEMPCKFALTNSTKVAI